MTCRIAVKPPTPIIGEVEAHERVPDGDGMQCGALPPSVPRERAETAT